MQRDVVDFRDRLVELYPAGAEHIQDGAREDPEVEPQAPLIDIPDVEPEPLAEYDRVPPVDLRPASDAGQHLMPPVLLRRVVRQVFHEQRTRSHQRHVAPHDVPQLRQFIEARLPKEPAHRSQALAVRLGFPIGVTRAGHRSKLQHVEWPPSEPGTLLAKENGRTHPYAREHGRDNNCRRQEHHPGEG